MNNSILKFFRPSYWKELQSQWRLVKTRVDNLQRSYQELAINFVQHKYIDLEKVKLPKKPLNLHELKIYSQNGEDGILLYLFSKIGVRSRNFIEFGIGNGKECNTANLSINLGWGGLLIEADIKKVEEARNHYSTVLGDFAGNVTISYNRVTTENINSIIGQFLKGNGLDLLSIDIDGNDYWIWKEIEVQARVVVIEYNATFGKDKRVTVPYDEYFDRFEKHESGYFHGASLPALIQLAERKGYIFVGCDSQGVNAFFVRKDVAEGKMSALTVQEAYFPQARRQKKSTLEEQFAQITHIPLIELPE